MSGPQVNPPSAFAGAARIDLVTIDEMSSLRHLHALSARRLAAGLLSEVEIEAFAEHVYSDGYVQRMAHAVRSGRMTGARLSDALVATAGWVPADDAGNVARLIGVFVSPLFAGKGLGRMVVERAEADARMAGFTVLTIRAPLSAEGFFHKLGYEPASHGVWPLTRETAMPVAFMRKAVSPATSAASSTQ